VPREFKCGGFLVEVRPVQHGQEAAWRAWLLERPEVSATAATPSEARALLGEKWKQIAATYRAAGEPVPKPPRRDHRRILATIRKLGQQDIEPYW